jgi:hypothetical protein
MRLLIDDILILGTKVILAFVLQASISLILFVLTIILHNGLERDKGIHRDQKLRYKFIRFRIYEVLAGVGDTQTMTGMARIALFLLLLMLMLMLISI